MAIDDGMYCILDMIEGTGDSVETQTTVRIPIDTPRSVAMFMSKLATGFASCDIDISTRKSVFAFLTVLASDDRAGAEDERKPMPKCVRRFLADLCLPKAWSLTKTMRDSDDDKDFALRAEHIIIPPTLVAEDEDEDEETVGSVMELYAEETLDSFTHLEAAMKHCYTSMVAATKAAAATAATENAKKRKTTN
jgi:hypothetical protein